MENLQPIYSGTKETNIAQLIIKSDVYWKLLICKNELIWI